MKFPDRNFPSWRFRSEDRPYWPIALLWPILKFCTTLMMLHGQVTGQGLNFRTFLKNGVKIDTFCSCRALWRSVTHFRARGQGRKRTFHFILLGWGVLLLEKHYLGCLQLKRMVPWGISDVYFSGDKKFRIIFWIIRIILFQEFFNFVPNDGLLLLFWCTRLSLLKYFNKRLF